MTRHTDAVRAAVRRAISELPDGSSRLLLVACSGGADSLALAAGAAEAARQVGWRAGAVIVDHQLQPGSDSVARRAAQQCQSRGLAPVLVERVMVTADGGPEAAAREARYAAVAAAAGREGAAAVLVAHTLDDQAETVLLGLARGSGARSLAGMARVATVPGSDVLMLRPLLGLRRAVLAGACADWGLVPWQDPHNSSPRFARSRVRGDLLPALEEALGPGVPPALARTADMLRDDEALLAQMAEQALAEMLAAGQCRQTADQLVADTAVLRELPPAVRRRVLHRLALRSGCPANDLTAGHIAEIDRLIMQQRSRGPIALPGRIQARRGCGRLAFAAAGDGSGE